MGEILFMGVLGILSLGMFTMTYGFKTSIIDKSGGPALYPRIIIVFLLVLMIIRTINILKTPKNEREGFAFLEIFKGIRLVYFLQFIAYVVLISIVGFKISSILFLNTLINYLSYKRTNKPPAPKTMLLLGIITIIGILVLDYCFTNLLNVPLPKGYFNI